MATTKNRLVERYQTLGGPKALDSIEPLIVKSEDFIAKKNNVNKDDVTGILISAILESKKKFPFPSIDVLLETKKKDVNDYVQFLWEYYKCPVNKKKPRINPPKKKKTLPTLENKQPENTTSPEEKPTEKPEVDISVSTQLVKKGDSVTITWKSTGADLVVDTLNFRIKDKKQVSGTTTIKVNRSCTFEIKVANEVGTSSSSIDVEVEEDDIIKNLSDEIKKSLKERDEAKKAVLSRFISPNFNKITDQLPLNLKKDKRIYKGMPLDFELDFDLACYVLVDSKEINSTDLPYLEWAKNVSGQDQDTLISHGKKVRTQVRLIGKEFKDLPMLHIPAVETDFTAKNQNNVNATSGSKKSSLKIAAPTVANVLTDKSRKVADLANTENPIVKLILAIQKTVDSILSSLTGQAKDTKKVKNIERRESEKKRRLLKEALSETPVKFLTKATEKLLAPVKGIIDRIINFLVFAILGKALMSLYEWSKDPKNKEKVDTIVRFLKDWWPTLLGAFILFGTGFGKMIRSSIGLVIRATRTLLKGIPRLIGFISKLNPKAKAVAALVVTGAGIYAATKLNQPKSEPEPPKKEPPKPTTTSRAKSAGEFYTTPVRKATGGGLISKIKTHPAMSYTQPEKINANDIAFNNGGLIQKESGVEITGAGKDTNLIAAQPGEVIISKSAVDHFGGPEFFLKLNAVGGGTNQPKFANNIEMKMGGGIVGSKTSPNLNITNNNTQSFSPSLGGLNLPSFPTPSLNASVSASPIPKGASGSSSSLMASPLGASGSSSSLMASAAGTKGASTSTKGTSPEANKKLTSAFNLPAVNIAMTHLKKDEALSSLTKGKNDFIKPNGKSAASGTPWSSLKDTTPIHAYLDSEKVPTIGWGATFYDSILSGKKPVKMGQTIQKKQADNIFKMQVLDLANHYSTKIKYWPMMTDNQRAGLLLVGFNAPNAPIGAYKKLTGALDVGDTKTATKELYRKGPNAERIATERKLLSSGPENLKVAPNKFLEFKKKEEAKNITPPPVAKPKPTNIIESIKTQFNKIFNISRSDVSTNIQPIVKQKPQITPLQPVTKTSFVTLPSMSGSNSNNITTPSQSGTGLPEFPSVSFAVEERMFNATTYGIG